MIPIIQMTTPRSLILSIWPEAAQEVAKQSTEPGLLAHLPLHPALSNFYKMRPLGQVSMFLFSEQTTE